MMVNAMKAKTRWLVAGLLTLVLAGTAIAQIVQRPLNPGTRKSAGISYWTAASEPAVAADGELAVRSNGVGTASDLVLFDSSAGGGWQRVLITSPSGGTDNTIPVWDAAGVLEDSVLDDVSGQMIITGSASQLSFPAGTVGDPAILFTDDDDGTGTGIYRVSANSLGIASNGVNVFRATTLGIDVIGAVQSSDGSFALPTYTYTSSSDDGGFLIGTSNLGWTVNGALVFDLEDPNQPGASATLATISSTLQAMDGSDTVNGLSLEITSANHTGASNVFNGINIASITGDAQAVETAILTSTGWDVILFVGSDGSATVPAISFADAGSGIYQDGANTVDFATSSQLRWTITSGGQLSSRSGGTAAAPDLSLGSGDFNTGVYSDSADTISFSTGGALIFDMEATNAAGASANLSTVSATLGIMNGSDTVNAFSAEITNVNHTGTGNTVNLLNLAAITGDAEANLNAIFIGALTGTAPSSGELEAAINVSSGWDVGLAMNTLGTAAAPAITFRELDDGFYSIGTNNLGLAMNGALVMDWEDTNLAGAGANLTTLRSTLGIMDGSDSVVGFLIGLTNANHTGAGNTLAALQINGITADVDATEYGIIIGAGWDFAIHLADNAGIQWEGATANTEELIMQVSDPTADVTVLHRAGLDLADTYHVLVVPDGELVTAAYTNSDQIPVVDAVAALVAGDNTMIVHRFYLPHPQTVITVDVLSIPLANVSAGDNTIAVGIYNDADDGAQIVEVVGATDDGAGGATQLESLNIADTTLEAGWYRIGFCAQDVSDHAIEGFQVNADILLLYGGGTGELVGTSANPCVTGNPAATTGSISGATDAIPFILVSN